MQVPNNFPKMNFKRILSFENIMTTPHGIIFAPPSTSKLLTFTTLNQQNEILNIPHIRSSIY